MMVPESNNLRAVRLLAVNMLGGEIPTALGVVKEGAVAKIDDRHYCGRSDEMVHHHEMGFFMRRAGVRQLCQRRQLYEL